MRLLLGVRRKSTIFPDYGKRILGALLVIITWNLTLPAQDSQQLDEADHQKEKSPVTLKEGHKKEIDVNFLFNYYSQDGNHSAVTGGEGTEDLSDRAMKIMVNIPLDSINTLRFSGHANVYTSASTDKIDSNVSSASKHDLRTQFDIDYTRNLLGKNQSYGFSFGGSTESDYISINAGLNWTKSLNNFNSKLSLAFKAYFDTWLLIFPEELRNKSETSFITTNRRRSFNLSVVYTQVINKKLQMALSGDIIYQNGLLSTPFHRVYFRESDMPKIERLPDSRIKFPLGIRINYFIADFLILRGYYRFYQDDFEIKAHTFSLETPFKFNSFFSVYPFYRYHQQSAAEYFAPFKAHLPDDPYFTSDHDLSAINSHKIGIGLHFAPVWGLGRFKLFSKKRITLFKSIDLRYAHYKRSDGLKATMISADFAFTSK